MRENRQSGSEGREARKRAFLTPMCAYDAHNPGWWKTIPQEYLSCETERNCVSARAGGEQLEVSCWSVTPSAKCGTESERDSA